MAGDERTGEETRPTSHEAATSGRVRVFGEGIAATHPIDPNRPVRVGRDAVCDVRIDHPSVSREHAEILILGDRVVVTDLGSRNGTRVAGVALPARTSAQATPGTAIAIGEVVVVVEVAAPPPAELVDSPRMKTVLARIDRVAPDDVTVLLFGETGVGKEVLAERLHARSRRKDGPLLKLHCAALAPTLVESELFGHEKGAFTGAASKKTGLLRAAHGGTVFIDEIGEVSAELQVKLLRVLEDRRVLPVGGTTFEPIDVRFVAATHRDLRQRAAEGTFREDLYYRLSGVTIDVPALRERREEIVPLAEKLLASACAERGRAPMRLSEGAREALLAHTFPGNVRELKAVVVRAVLFAESTVIEAADIVVDRPATAPRTKVEEPPRTPASTASENAGSADERARIEAALEACAGNQTEAAKRLGIARRTLLYRLDALGIARPRKR